MGQPPGIRVVCNPFSFDLAMRSCPRSRRPCGMDGDQLRTWLALAPGVWPPNEGELLGPAGQGDGHERAMHLMERLRPHQLLHPELVTEGMNRIAQALIAWEAGPASREPVVVQAEVLEVLPVLEPSGISKTVPRKKRKRKTAAAAESVPVPTIAPPPGLMKAVQDRRKSYRQLVMQRRFLERWQALGPFFGVPSQEMVQSSEVLKYLEAVQGCRQMLLAPGAHAQPVSGLGRSIVLNTASISLFRSLQPSQRLALAHDWALCLATLQAEVQLLQSSLKMTKPKPTLKRRLKACGVRLRSEPAWLLLPILGVAVLIALLRSR